MASVSNNSEESQNAASAAPAPKRAERVQPLDISTQDYSSSASIPTVSVFGCGGCGINLVRLSDKYLRPTKVRLMDTSLANKRDGENIILITEGNGSGKVRSEHAEAIQKKIANLSPEELNLSDINIVLMSMSGGSGSVIGPVLIRELHRRKGLTIAIMVADTGSERDTINTLNTLKTLEAIALKNNVYLPTMIFDNKTGREVVDVSVVHRLSLLITLLTASAIEVDRNDRRNWLDGIKTSNLPSGLRQLHVTNELITDDHPIWIQGGEIWGGLRDHIFDGMLHVAGDVTNGRLDGNTKRRAVYDGRFTNPSMKTIVGIVGNHPDAFQNLIDEINDSINDYSSQRMAVKSISGLKDTEIDESGLVF